MQNANTDSHRLGYIFMENGKRDFIYLGYETQYFRK